MAQQVITIKRKKYATGLVWQPIAGKDGARAYAKDLSRKISKNANLYVEYKGMVGLGSTKLGHKSGMTAVAPALVEVLSEYHSFVGAFPTDGGFWILAIRNGIILHDIFYQPGSEEQAKTFYTHIAELPDWAALFAPGTWAHPRAIEKFLNDFPGIPMKLPLKPISNLKTNILMLVFGLLFAALVGFIFRNPIKQIFMPHPQTMQIDPILADEYKKRIEEKERELARQYELERKRPVQRQVDNLPYDNLPDVQSRADVCMRAIGFLMQPIPGWSQVYVECGLDYAVADLRRGFGTVADFYAVGEILLPGVGVTEKSDSELILSVKLPAVPLYASLSESDAATVMREINSLFQVIDQNAIIQPNMEMIEQDGRSVAINTVEIKTDSKITPPEFVKIFYGIDGVSIPFVKWDAKKRQWNYEVKIYVK